jgi:hypothetical protein
MKGPAAQFLIVKTLDEFHVWPVKHRHWNFEIVEDEIHDVWVNTRHLRSFYPALPSDKALKQVYGRTMLYAKDVKAHYLSERAMRLELRKGSRTQVATDALKFLDWFERNVSTVSAKKRSNRKADVQHAVSLENTEIVQLGPLPGALAPLHLEASTMPFSEGEAWRRVAHDSDVPKVYHPDARVFRTPWTEWVRAHVLSIASWLVSMWRGEQSFRVVLLFSFLLAYVPSLIQNWWIPESLDWTVNYRRVLWGYAAVVPLAFAWSVWFSVSLWRRTKLAFDEPGGKIWATVVFALAIPSAPGYLFSKYDKEMLEPWWEMVSGRYRPADVSADPHLGRIVVTGRLKYGSADALQAVMQQNPKMTLVQIESPGGYVIEGLRMADLILKSNRDTVSLERCASACTLLLAAGQERYLGPNARVAFHRSGTKYGPVDDGWSEVDHELADFWKSRGVSTDFIDQALTPSIRQIWVAPHHEMYAAHYATLKWSERGTKY